MPSVHRRSIFIRILFSIVILLLAGPAIYRSYGIFRADRIIRSEQTVESYSRALEYDPSNATLWWKRGRLRHYSVKDVDIIKAAGDYQRALSLNRRLGQAWVDLSDCFERMGRYHEAEAALEKAFSTQRYSPLIRWQAGNYFLRRGNLPGMYDCFKMASRYEGDKLPIAVDLAWKIDPDHAGMLEKLVPDDLRSNLTYLAFLVRRDELDLAAQVWERCRKNPIPDDFEFKPSAAFHYIDRLLAKNRIPEALQIWEDALRKSGAGTHRQDARNLVWNGSFERELLRGGFDWRYPETPDIRIRVDSGNRMDKLKSLRITFGDANIAAICLSQIVPIPGPGSYRIDFYLRTEGLTTDQLPYAAVRGYPDAAGASGRSAFFPSAAEWSKVSVPFTANEGIGAIQLSLRRDRSSKFDNQIKGSMWLDGFSITTAVFQ